MLAKGIHQIAQIEFENYNFLASDKGTPLRHPLF